jgi:hypothetical protein
VHQACRPLSKEIVDFLAIRSPCGEISEYDRWERFHGFNFRLALLFLFRFPLLLLLFSLCPLNPNAAASSSSIRSSPMLSSTMAPFPATQMSHPLCHVLRRIFSNRRASIYSCSSSCAWWWIWRTVSCWYQQNDAGLLKQSRTYTSSRWRKKH